ncbi:MAG: DUF1002 domain-containing protein [Clostridia bacterium]|nr:DUF1002 domain-containing protein [Clostridia bacterium]
MKRIISVILALVFIAGSLSLTSASAMDEGDWRIVLGHDLTESEINTVYELFGLGDSEGLDANRILSVTNSEERFYLSGKMPDAKIGKRAVSSIFICALPEGSGLNITVKNISYCTAEMYENALLTVGITDAEIIVASPRPVSGTAALTGIYKAYESLTGSIISDYIKQAGIDELLTTGDLAEIIGSDEATEVITELKKILDETMHMTDDEVKTVIREIATENEVELTEQNVSQILTLARTLEGLDVEQIRARALGLAKSVSTWQKIAGGFKAVFAEIGEFFKDVAEFLRDVFTKFFAPAAEE